ncbi:ice-binding family protein [Pontibacter liquoris]|uniref:ice-binding family protein n=1 Tax=Pontibacter liquoris TaxID=2905677 RepID=UPI001FA7DED9|nr:ice-binding family protein [Pontibacter liquoris]
MNRVLLLICLFLTASTLSFAQSDPTLGQASEFAVLAATTVNNTGTTGVSGRLGIAPGTTVNDAGTLLVSHTPMHLGTDLAIQAQADAQKAYDFLKGRPVTGTLPNNMGGFMVTPGVYRIDGDAALNGILRLDGAGNIDGIFIFVISGKFTSGQPLPPTPSTGLLLQNGAQAKNVYWVVEGDVTLGGSTLLQGTIISNGNIDLGMGVGLIGRAISLKGSVTLNTNNIFLPTVVTNDLSIEKKAVAGDYTVGSTVTYVIKTKNSGPNDASNVVVTEDFPLDGLEFISVVAEKGEVRLDTDGKYRWYVGDLKNGEEASLTVTFKILAAGTINNRVTIIAKDPDPDPTDNEGEAPVAVPCAKPTLELTGESSFCTPLLNTTYTVTKVPDAVSYTFDLPVGWTKVSQTDNTITVNAPVSGTIKATVKNVCGETATIEKQVQLLPALGTTTIDGAAATCQDTQQLVYRAGSAGADAYAWTATGDVTIVGSTTADTVVVNVGAAGGSLKLVASNNCFTATALKTITTTAKPAAPAAITGNADVCAGTNATFTVADVTGATGYTWTVPAGWTIVSGQGTGTLVVKASDAAGNITVTADNNCGSSAATTMALTASAKPTKPVITGDAASCAGTTLTYSVADVADATGYTWSVPTGWTIKKGQNTTTIEVEVGSTAGDVKVVVANKCGDSEAGSLAVKGLTAPATPAAITGTAAVCASSEALTYTFANAENGAVYTWAVPAGWTIVSGQGTGTITVNAGTAGGTISVSGTNTCGTSGTATTEVTITTPPAAPGPIRDKSNVCDGLVYTIDAVSGATSYTWTVSTGFTIIEGQGTTSIKVKASQPTASGEVTVVANNGTCGSAVATATMDAALADGQLNFPKAFSPNNDGRNDTWEISNLLKFPDNEVLIFNRWGSEVYRKKSYQNDWNGNKLEAGTYFYKVRVKLCNGVDKEFTGYVAIFR